MKLSDMHPILGLTVEEYYYECYEMPEHGGIKPVQSFERRDRVQAYVVKSNTKGRCEDTLYRSGGGSAPFEKLASLEFYFIILVQDFKPDMMTIPNEVFEYEEDAAAHAKVILKKYHKQ